LNKQATSGPVSQRIWQHPEFAQGARDMLPVAPGIAAWGLMTGVAMMKSGLSLVESLAMALTVFAGSSQLASMPLIVAGAPIWVVLATGLCVNLRFVVFSIHLRPYVMHQPLWRRLVSGYLTADLSYVMFVKRFPHPVPKDDLVSTRAALGRPEQASAPSGGSAAHAVASVGALLRGQEAYLGGNCFVNWVSWVGASLLGIALANLIPPHWGLGFAGILALVGVASSLASSRLRMVSAAVAGAAAVAAFALPLKLNILVAICVAVVVCLLLEKLRPALPGTMQPPAPGAQPKGKA
jgi:predicted branched-subunit amino acid permease